jgi:hypothetical protein
MIFHRPALSVALGLTLVLSLMLKLPGLTGLAAATRANVITPDVATLLERYGYEVQHHVDESDTSLTWTSGSAAECHILVASVALQGWHNSLIAQMASGNRLAYMFNGRVYAEQPILRTRAQHYWTKFQNYLGLDVPIHPLFAVITVPACQDVPLVELARLTER